MKYVHAEVYSPLFFFAEFVGHTFVGIDNASANS